MPLTSLPLKHSHVFKDHLATNTGSLHCINSQAKRVTLSRAHHISQTQISYFLKSLPCNLLFRSDSMSLFRVSFSLRSWKLRKQKKGKTLTIGKKSAAMRKTKMALLLDNTKGEERTGEKGNTSAGCCVSLENNDRERSSFNEKRKSTALALQ